MSSSSNVPTILIVDDNPANIEVLGGILSDDYEVIVATNGEQAVEIATSDYTPDLILLDIMMPVMDGYEVCKILKAHQSASKIPVIMVSAKSEESDETYGFETGIADYIKKPVNPAIVKARIKTQLMLKGYQDQLEMQLIKSKNESKKQKTYFSQLFRNSPQAIISIDLEGRIVDANQEFESLFGYQLKELRSKKTIDLIVPDDKKSEHRRFLENVFHGNTKQLETERKHQNGRLIPVCMFGYSVLVDSEFKGLFIILSTG